MKATEINASLIGKNVKHNTTDDILKIFGVAMNDADAHDFSSVHIGVYCHPITNCKTDKKRTFVFTELVKPSETARKSEQLSYDARKCNGNLHLVDLM